MRNTIITHDQVQLFPVSRGTAVVTYEQGAGAIQAKTDCESLNAVNKGPNKKAAELAARHQMTPSEVKRLFQVIEEWPADAVYQGLREEIADIMADRELAEMKPLTIADVEAMQETLDRLNEQFDCVG